MNILNIDPSVFVELSSLDQNKDKYYLLDKDTTTSFDNTKSGNFDVKSNSYPINAAATICDDIKIKAAEIYIYELITKGELDKVREALKKLGDISSPLIQKWKKALWRDPVVNKKKASLKNEEIINESKSLKSNSKELSSKWVAFIDGNVVAYDDNLISLKEKLNMENHIGVITFLKK